MPQAKKQSVASSSIEQAKLFLRGAATHVVYDVLLDGVLDGTTILRTEKLVRERLTTKEIERINKFNEWEKRVLNIMPANIILTNERIWDRLKPESICYGSSVDRAIWSLVRRGYLERPIKGHVKLTEHGINARISIVLKNLP